jgi:tripartite-type tricarboxylate transporter receptor subunit TctC
MTLVRTAVHLALVCMLTSVMSGVHAADYPSKPIRWILGFPGGGASDILARTIALKLTQALGQQVVVDNRAGASGIIANELAAKAPADGYTILLVSSTYANLIAIGKKLPYDHDRDLAPVILLASVPSILVTHPSLPVRSTKDLIALAKSRPGQINFGTGGAASSPHFATELFGLMTGIKIVHIPYKGMPPAVNDLLAGNVQMMFANAPPAMPHVKAGKLRALAVSGSKRLTELPDVPTVAETVPGYEANSWFGLLVPRGVPGAIIDRLNGEIGKILTMPDVQERLMAVGFEIDGGSAANFGQFIKSEITKWRRVSKETNITAE